MPRFPSYSIEKETNKIDIAATTNLLGVSNSLAYIAKETEDHLHSKGRCTEKTLVILSC